MRDLAVILSEIEKDLRDQGEPEDEIQRMLALPPKELVDAMRCRAAAQIAEADALIEYGESRLGPNVRFIDRPKKK